MYDFKAIVHSGLCMSSASSFSGVCIHNHYTAQCRDIYNNLSACLNICRDMKLDATYIKSPTVENSVSGDRFLQYYMLHSFRFTSTSGYERERERKESRSSYRKWALCVRPYTVKKKHRSKTHSHFGPRPIVFFTVSTTKNTLLLELEK